MKSHSAPAWVIVFALVGLLHLAPPLQAQTGGILREVYDNLSGSLLEDLTNAPVFPDRPTSTNIITDVFEAPTDFDDNYGQRLRGLILPPVSGAYTFWIASDDQSALFLSTDEDPDNKRLIAMVDGYTASRAWFDEAGQQSSAITLVGGRRYYIEALMKEGGGGDNLAVRWQLPDGTIEEPIPASRLTLPGTTLLPPIIGQQPTNTVALEGATALFRVSLRFGAVASYQWLRNGTEIPGANSPVYTNSIVPLTDQGARYRCVLTNAAGSAISEEAVLTVIPDRTPPVLVQAYNVGVSNVVVVYSEPVFSATRTNDYALDGNVQVRSAVFTAPNIITLETTTLQLRTTYHLTVNRVTDRSAAANPIAPNSTASFVALELTSGTVGSPSAATEVTGLASGLRVVTTGLGTGGTNDQLHLSYQERTGNFDLMVRVESLSLSDPWATAGIMARGNLAPNSPFAAMLATPTFAGCFFESRLQSNSVSARQGFFPVNFPETWLRLRRTNDLFTGYASFDSVTWTEIGSTRLLFTNSIYVGLAVASRQTNRPVVAAFRDYLGLIPSQSRGVLPADREPLGPSSRRTGLALSEIMYHPPARSDGKDLEYVELFNAQVVDEDLTGYRLTGAIDYDIPAGTILRAGDFLVIGRTPADLRSAYGLETVLGGYTNRLQNSSGTLRLLHRQGAVLLEAHYSGAPPWPASADGAGHSLVLARPSYGEADPRAWSASDLIGGSPGRDEPRLGDPVRPVLINEYLAHTDDPELDFVEIYNHSREDVVIGGCSLSDDPLTDKFVFPAGTVLPASGFLALNQNQLGFALSSAGETLYFKNADRQRVIDAVRFGPQANGRSAGRYPDGAPAFYPLERTTPGAANSLPWRSDVVISEIMYNPLAGGDGEYVELHNRSATAVDLSGWRFTDGVDFTFPAGTLLAGQGYLAVARNAAYLLSTHTNLASTSVVGDFDGNLSNSGERLALSRPEALVGTNAQGRFVTNHVFVVVNEVTYGSGGRWGLWSDGGGSSLELIDTSSDNRLSSNWADSDETKKADWSIIEASGVLDQGMEGMPIDDVEVLLLGAGECLVDNVEVLGPGGVNVVGNSTFEGGTSGWSLRGNHSKSELENREGYQSRRSLLLRGSGRGDTGPNQARSPLSITLDVGTRVTLRARARWLRGHPELLLKVHGNYLEATGPLSVPLNLGTPGARNSRAVENAGPAIYDVRHSPVLPAVNEPVVVSARVSDPDGVSAVTLGYRFDPSVTVLTTNMVDNGQNGDAVAGDGIYSATLPGLGVRHLMAFHVQATDTGIRRATSTFPSDATNRECLVVFGETQPSGGLGAYRLWFTEGTRSTWALRERGSNEGLDITFVYGNSRVIYNAQGLYSGSPYHWTGYDDPVTDRCNYQLLTPTDDSFLGVTEAILNMPSNLASDNTLIREQVVYWMIDQLGEPYTYRRFHHVFVNGLQRGPIFEDAQQPNREFVRQWYPQDTDGELYKIEDWFEFYEDLYGFLNRDATLEVFRLPDGTLKSAPYRWMWRKRSVQDSANNFTSLFALVEALNSQTSGDAYTAGVERLVNVEQWMKAMSIRHVVGDWDAYGYRRGKNMFAYKPADGRWELLHWDIAFSLGLGDGPTRDLFDVRHFDGRIDPVTDRMYRHPPFRRLYLQALQDAAEGPLLSDRVGPVIDRLGAAVAGSGVRASSPNSLKSWIASRRNYILAVLSTNQAEFSITSNGGKDFSTNRNDIVVEGTAPLDARTLRANGVAYTVTWPEVNRWRMRIPIQSGPNRLEFVAYDRDGKALGAAPSAITITFTGPKELPEENLVINEIMYDPAVPDTEFIEIHNTSTITTFDLSQYRLEGVDFTFPDGTVISPLGFVVVVANQAAFERAYGSGASVAGEYAGRLDRGGETLTLLKPGATGDSNPVADWVAYDDDPPWPSAARGGGASLQVIDPYVDNSRLANWMVADRAANVALATPGQPNSVSDILMALPALYLSELQPENAGGLKDAAGDADPWIELVNQGAEVIDLSGLYLSDTYTNLDRWAFPANTRLAPGQYLVVWADGEPQESSAGELHTSFRLAPGTGTVALSQLQNGRLAVLDYFNYTGVNRGHSFGRLPDERRPVVLITPTPGRANTSGGATPALFINEWLAGNTSTVPDPADGDFDDWFELFNAGDAPMNLGGFTLTDTLADPAKFVIPAETWIPAGGFLLVWADEENRQNGRTGDLHVNFKLSLAGEAIGLFAPDGTAVDTIEFGPQTNDVSQGRWPDGSASIGFLSVATPRASNAASTPPVAQVRITSAVVAEGGAVRLSWVSQPGKTYRVEFKGALSAAAWQALLNPITATGALTSATDSGVGAVSERYYRIVMLPAP